MSAKRIEVSGIEIPQPWRRPKGLHELIAMAAILLLGLILTTEMRAQCAVDGFDPGANGPIDAMAIQPDGKIVVVGRFTTIGGGGTGTTNRSRIARLNPDGTVDASFDPGATSDVYALALQPDGKIVVGGIFQNLGGMPRGRLGRLNADGTLDTTFNPGANVGVYSLALQADGKILIGGGFTMLGGGGAGTNPRIRLGRLNPDGTLDASFDPGANATVHGLAVQPDGKILVGGVFSMLGGGGSGTTPRRCIGRLNADGTLDNSFDPGASSGVTELTVQADGKILVGGEFTMLGGGGSGTSMRSKIGRLNADGTLDAAFDPGANGIVRSLALQADGKVVVGGFFSTLGGGGTGTTTRHNIGRVHPDGSLDTSFDAGAGSGLLAVAIQADGKIVAGGEFTTLGGGGTGTTTRNKIGRLFPDCTTAPPSTLANISTRLRVETGDNVLIGGFIVTGTQAKRIIVRALGPSLPLAGALADPVLELRDGSGALILSNDNWRIGGQEAEIIATTIPPSHDSESAVVATLPANSSGYTAIVRGVSDGTGIGVVEVYDLDPTVDSKLANISTRGLVQTGDNVLIGGLIVLGQNPLRVIVRAIGPSLPLPGALGDPTLELRDGDGALVASNNNWREDPGQESEIIATGIPPSDDLESAIVRNLTPGNYTAIVRGVNNTTGIAVVEAYGLN